MNSIVGKFFLFHLPIAVLATFGMSACSFPGMNGKELECPELTVGFAGPDHPVVCAGTPVDVRVMMADESVNVEYLITASDGELKTKFGQPGVWTFQNDGTPGNTSFRVYIEAACGSTVSTFELSNIKCDDTGSQIGPADTETAAGDTDTAANIGTATADTGTTGDTATESETMVDTDSGTAVDSGTAAATGDTDSQPPSDAHPMPPEISYDGPRHVILFIGDGMGQPCETGLSRYLYGTDTGLSFHAFPYANYVTTWDIDTYNRRADDEGAPHYSEDNFNATIGYDPTRGGAKVLRGDETSWDYILFGGFGSTDSGAAATALATGHKTDANNIAWQTGDPEDGALETIAEQARQQNMKMGVVSTVGFSHATPACFVSHNVYRGNYHEIAREILFDTTPDVVIGAGHPGASENYSFLSEAEYYWLSLTDTLVFAEGAKGVAGSETLAAAATTAVERQQRLFGLFGNDTFGESSPVNHPGVPEFAYALTEEPTLSDAVRAAVDVLANDDKGFFLMVEGGAIDKANHQNNYQRMIGNMWGFDRAVQTAVDWVNEEGDEVTMDNTLIIVTADHANGYITFNDNYPLGQGELPGGGVTDPDSDTTSAIQQVTYGTTGHTNEMVRVYATGAGIAGGANRLFAPYEYENYPAYPIIDNTQIYKAMAHFIGVTE